MEVIVHFLKNKTTLYNSSGIAQHSWQNILLNNIDLICTELYCYLREKKTKNVCKDKKKKSALGVTAGPNRVTNMQKAKNKQT